MDNSKGKELWATAVRVIPGGNGLLSKRPDRYAPDIWPTYFSECSGVHVTDIDGNRYVDMAQMGIGSAILGYTNVESQNEGSADTKDGSAWYIGANMSF